jgi:hypothetical protein
MKPYKTFNSCIPIGQRPHPPEQMGTNEEPWYTRGSIEFLVDIIQDYFEILEYGCGSSTPWFAQRAKNIVSIEHEKMWIDQVMSKIPKELANKIEIIHIPNQQTGKHIGGDGAYYDNYVDYINHTDRLFDMICVDGRSRSACIRNSISHVKTGGFLLIDNAERTEYQQAISEIPKTWERFIFEEEVDTTMIFRAVT